MATADEKQAAQDARDAARQSVTVGQQRLNTEVTQAAAAFPRRTLRSAGDLARYAIGGFLSDPNAPLPVHTPTPTAAPAPVRTGSSGARGSAYSGSGATAPAPSGGGSLAPSAGVVPGTSAWDRAHHTGYPQPPVSNPTAADSALRHTTSINAGALYNQPYTSGSRQAEDIGPSALKPGPTAEDSRLRHTTSLEATIPKPTAADSKARHTGPPKPPVKKPTAKASALRHTTPTKPSKPAKKPTAKASAARHTTPPVKKPAPKPATGPRRA